MWETEITVLTIGVVVLIILFWRYGKHKVEAYRFFRYKNIPVTINATLFDVLHGKDVSEGNMDKMPIIGNAIQPLVGEPMFVKSRRIELSPEAAADLGITDATTTGHTQRLHVKATEVAAKKGLKFSTNRNV